jgi:uncharacterized membrane protein YoaT (DUF817 family)
MSTARESRVDWYLSRILPPIEAWLGRFLPRMVVLALVEFVVFGVKQAWACLFGGLLLAALLLTGWYWPDSWVLSRYDALVLFAVGVQLLFLATGLERPREGLVIVVFHVVGTLMELFKTQVGSWTYPEESLLRIGGVPLFSGFMYAAVGSYFARVFRTFDFEFDHYPRRRWTGLLGLAIYVNFFTHHFIVDIRWVLFAATALLFGRTVVHYRVWRWQHRMPLLLGFVLVAFFIWIAENVGTFAGAWLYPDQAAGWRMVSIAKMGSWFLLMIISWVLVSLIHKPPLRSAERHVVDKARAPEHHGGE